jgi:hypothetical protein
LLSPQNVKSSTTSNSHVPVISTDQNHNTLLSKHLQTLLSPMRSFPTFSSTKLIRLEYFI